MTITLSPDQKAWLQSRVANDEFASVEAAARQLLAEPIAELEEGGDEADDDLAWAKPYVDEGLAAFARGEFITLEEHRARNAARRAARGK